MFFGPVCLDFYYPIVDKDLPSLLNFIVVICPAIDNKVVFHLTQGYVMLHLVVVDFAACQKQLLRSLQKDVWFHLVDNTFIHSQELNAYMLIIPFAVQDVILFDKIP